MGHPPLRNPQKCSDRAEIYQKGCKTKILRKGKKIIGLASIFRPLDLKTPIFATRQPKYVRYGNLNNVPNFYARDLVFFNPILHGVFRQRILHGGGDVNILQN